MVMILGKGSSNSSHRREASSSTIPSLRDSLALMMMVISAAIPRRYIMPITSSVSNDLWMKSSDSKCTPAYSGPNWQLRDMVMAGASRDPSAHNGSPSSRLVLRDGLRLTKNTKSLQTRTDYQAPGRSFNFKYTAKWMRGISPSSLSTVRTLLACLKASWLPIIEDHRICGNSSSFMRLRPTTSSCTVLLMASTSRWNPMAMCIAMSFMMAMLPNGPLLVNETFPSHTQTFI